ncbi:MAG: glycosyltransferase family 2 protein [Terriglobales bacterium]
MQATQVESKVGGPQPAATPPHCVRVSVCMAAYNGERFIRRQISSILPQLSAEDELVIVDDGSADGSVAIIEAFRDSRVKLLRNEHNFGVVRTFERALRGARGDLVFLSDQDDIWRPEKVAVCRAYFDSHPEVGLVLSDADVIDGAERVIAATWMIDGSFRDGILANLIRNRYLGCVMAFRSQLLTRCLPFPPGLPMHDMWIGMVNRLGGKAALIPQVLMSYRRHGGNATAGQHAPWEQMLSWRVALAKNLVRFYVRDVLLGKPGGSIGSPPPGPTMGPTLVESGLCRLPVPNWRDRKPS